MIINVHRLLIILLILSFSSAPPGYSQNTEKEFIEDMYSEVSIGYQHYNVKGNRGKVGEYDLLDTGAWTSFILEGQRGSNYFDINASILDEDDQTYTVNIDFNRVLRSNLSYSRFRHFLDHDPLSNQDFVTDFGSDKQNGITIEEVASKNAIRFPALPFLKFHVDYRTYSKRGHRQATTIAKCSQCHVSSKNKRINEKTQDIRVGVEAMIGPATVSYSHFWRSFNENADAPSINYGNGASFFLTNGSAKFSRVPDSTTKIHKVKLKSTLPFNSSLFASYHLGKRENRDTYNDIDFNSYSARLCKSFGRNVSLDIYYNKYNLDNNTPGGIERDVEKGGVDLSGHFMRRTSLKFSYKWENIDRNNFTEGSTYKEIYKISFNHRPLKKMRFHAKYKKTKIDDPFVMKDNSYKMLSFTSLPSSEDQLYFSLNWTLLYNLSLNTNFRYIKGENDRFDVDEDRYEFIMSLWYAPLADMTLTASYTFIDNEVDTPAAFKSYHLDGLKNVYIFDEIPYDDRSQSYFLSATYLLNPQTSLTGEFSFIQSNADFDARIGSKNVGELSDLEIEQLQVSFGATYLYSDRLSLYGKYMFRDYNDRKENYLDGQFTLFSFGVNWTF